MGWCIWEDVGGEAIGDRGGGEGEKTVEGGLIG